jgi:hypothetical protein
MPAKTLDCDLLVLGAGGSGLVAAVKASEDGVKNVIVIEKAKKPGGASWFAGGPGVGSQQGGGGPRGGGPGGPGGSGRGGPGGGGPGGMGGGASQNPMGQFTSWFTAKVGAENMVKAARMEKYKDLPDPSIGPGRGGTFTVLKMLEFCQKQGVRILYETPAKKFITDGKGKVTHVQADTRDGQLVINCKACVVATGGFGRNYEKLKKYWPESYNNKEIFFLCPPGMMGDGIDMAEAAGAHIDQTKWSQDAAGGFFGDGPMHHPYSWAVQSLMQGGGFVYINLEGKRWQQGRGNSLASQPGGVVYAVADNAIVEAAGAQLGSGAGGMGGMMANMASDPNSNEAKAIKKWKEDLEYEAAIDDEGAHGHHVKKANSLVELALKMQIDPAVFVATIESYNRAIESGREQDSGGPGGPGGMGGPGGPGGPGGMGGPGGPGGPGGMGGPGGRGGPGGGQARKAIKTAPFWAIYGHRFSQCTKGLNGIAVNSSFEVLNPKGEAMPGLYAAGDTCTIYGGLVLQGGPAGERLAQRASSAAPAGGNLLSTTPSPCGGSMAAFISGFSAGLHAAEYLKKA